MSAAPRFGRPRRYHLASAAAAIMLLAPMVATAIAPPPAEVEQGAGAASGQHAPVEGFMMLTGRIMVGAHGRVTGFGIDRAESVPDEVRAFLSRQVAGWRVEFDAGVPPPTRPVSFSVRVRASPAGDGLYGLWLDGVHLEEPLPAAHRLQATRMRQPAYPRAMAEVGASGIVYMLAKIGTDGRVEDAFAEQVDLTAMPADPADFVKYQLEFMASAAAAVRQWRFAVPVEGPYAGAPQALRIPMVFMMHDRPTAYGEWEYLVRGVRKRPPWSSEIDPDVQDALASTGVQPARSRMRVVQEGGGSGG